VPENLQEANAFRDRIKWEKILTGSIVMVTNVASNIKRSSGNI
jgi:hypothetical protein